MTEQRDFLGGEWRCAHGVPWLSQQYPSFIPNHPTFGTWMVCQVARRERLGRLLVKLGVLDAASDGGVLFWRWDFWNSNIRRMLKEAETECMRRK